MRNTKRITQVGVAALLIMAIGRSASGKDTRVSTTELARYAEFIGCVRVESVAPPRSQQKQRGRRSVGKKSSKGAARTVSPPIPVPLAIPANLDSETAYAMWMERVTKSAAHIHIGMTRAEVEKVFSQQAGGIQGSSLTRYYTGNEVMLDVPYDQTGGNWKPTNRVTGLVTVYHSAMSFD